MKRAIIVVAGLVMVFTTMGVALGANVAPSDNAMATFTGTETQSTPALCGTGFVTTVVTLKGTSTDNSTIFGTADPGPFTLTSPSNGLLIRAATTVNTNTGQGYSKGTFYLKEDATHRVYGTFSAVQQVLDQATGTAVGRGFVTANAQKHVTVRGKRVWKNTGHLLVANTEFTAGNGNVQGFLGSDTNPQTGAPTVQPQVGDYSTKTRFCS